MPSILHRFLPALRLLRRRSRLGHPITLGELVHSLGHQAPAVGAALLALPFVLPFSLGPITAPFAFTILLLGWAVWCQRSRLWLPRRLSEALIPGNVAGILRSIVVRAARWRNRRAWPERFGQLIPAVHAHRIGAGGIMAGALLLAVPIPLLPLTNTFPALAIVCFAHYHIEHNEALVWLGALSLLVSIAIFGLLAWLLLVVGMDLYHFLPHLCGSVGSGAAQAP
jgi:hypothetical protein